MTSKLQAAEIADRAGIALAIANGTAPGPVARALFQGIGTLFVPTGKPGRATARKAWLGGRLRLKGAVTIDAGAAAALARGSSLLATGVTAIEGEFARGDAVAIRNAQGRVLAHGLSEYDAGDCARWSAPTAAIRRQSLAMRRVRRWSTGTRWCCCDAGTYWRDRLCWPGPARPGAGRQDTRSAR